MSIQSHGNLHAHEHEFEPQLGLPERLPTGEHILWQGTPDFTTLALKVFHLRKVALYFAVLMAWRAGVVWSEGAGLADTLASLVWPLPLALLALAALATLAWLTARTTVYTLTQRRVVMRVGIVLTLTFNIPLKVVAAAALRPLPADTGDIVLTLAGRDRIAWLQLWPHVRPWHLARPEPMLRCVPQAAHVAQLLSQAWSANTGVAAQTAPAVAAGAAEAPQATPHWQPSPT
jgi:Bacterial PH domain